MCAKNTHLKTSFKAKSDSCTSLLNGWHACVRVCVMARCFGISRNAWHSFGCAGECDDSVINSVFRLFSHGKKNETDALAHICDFFWRTILLCWGSRTVKGARNVSCNCHHRQNLGIQNFFLIVSGNCDMALLIGREWDPSGRERIITHKLSVAADMKKRNIVWKTIGNKRFNLFWPRPVFPALNSLFVSYFPTYAFH